MMDDAVVIVGVMFIVAGLLGFVLCLVKMIKDKGIPGND